MATTPTGTAKQRAYWEGKRGFTDEEVVAAISAGQTLDEICITFQCSERVIDRLCERAAIPVFRLGRKPSPWTAERVAVLRAGWFNGETTAALGRKLGVPKNAIVGKASREDLPPRPNPMRPDPEGAPKRVRATTKRGPTAKKARGEPLASELPPLRQTKVPKPPKPKFTAPKFQPTPIPRRGLVTDCCWPFGSGRTLRYCDAPTLPGDPYCPEHYALAHEKKAA